MLIKPESRPDSDYELHDSTAASNNVAGISLNVCGVLCIPSDKWDDSSGLTGLFANYVASV